MKPSITKKLKQHFLFETIGSHEGLFSLTASLFGSASLHFIAFQRAERTPLLLQSFNRSAHHFLKGLKMDLIAVVLALIVSGVWSVALNRKAERKLKERSEIGNVSKDTKEDLQVLSKSIQDVESIQRVLSNLLDEIHACGCETQRTNEIYRVPG